MVRSMAARDLTCLAETPALAREVFFGPQTPEATIVNAQPRLKGAPLRAFIDMGFRVAPRPLAGTPTLVLAGAHDRNFTLTVERRLAQRLAGELMVAENSGHDIPLDVEWRGTAERVLGWLERAGAMKRPSLRAAGAERAAAASDGAE
jgi:pimeloyl-ACP methyl ester carboxylesterase